MCLKITTFYCVTVLLRCLHIIRQWNEMTKFGIPKFFFWESAYQHIVWCNVLTKASVNRVTGYLPERTGFDFQQGQELLFLLLLSDWIWGPPSILFKGYQGLFSLGGGGDKCDADYSPSSIAKIQMHGVFSPCFLNAGAWAEGKTIFLPS
jgi:hypothetical protein